VSARLEVAVGVVLDADGRVLLGQRVAGKAYAGWWEFPGGKIEAGEDAAVALARELDEELGLAVRASHPWMVREFVYPHAHVRLHFRRLFAAWGDWAGEPRGREGQAFAWQSCAGPVVEPLLPASVPVFPWLRLPAILTAWRPGDPDASIDRGRERQALAHAGLPGLLAACVPVRVLRGSWSPDPGFEAEVAAAAAALQRLGGGLLVSSRLPAGAAALTGAVLVEAADLRRLDARPSARLCAARCREPADLERAADLGFDLAIASRPDPDARLPVYVPRTGDALGAIMRAGAHGVADGDGVADLAAAG
jgi:8-oxo-dGTP diphosphatase